MTGARRRLGLARKAASLLAVAVLVQLVLALPTAAGDADVANEKLDADLHFRRIFGLTTSLDAVAAVRAAPASQSLETYGVALSDSEEADIDARFALQDEIGIYSDQATRLPGFAGFYVDQAAGGEIVLLATEAGRSHVEEFIERRPVGSRARMTVVDWSWQDLTAVRAQIEQDWTDLERDGLNLATLGTDVAANRVVLGIENPPADFGETLAARYGPMLTVVEQNEPESGACTSRSNCWSPAKAGLRLSTPSNGLCVSGFVAHDGPGGNVYLFTAAHCGDGTYQHPDGTNIGGSTLDARYANSTADVRIIDISNSQESNKVYLTASTTKSITSRLLYYYDYTGQAVCTSSYYYGVNCGTITDDDTSGDWDGIHWTHQRRANYSAHQGDSGGPVWISGTNQAEGSSAAFTSDTNWYFSQAGYVEEAINTPLDELLICTSSTC